MEVRVQMEQGTTMETTEEIREAGWDSNEVLLRKRRSGVDQHKEKESKTASVVLSVASCPGDQRMGEVKRKYEKDVGDVRKQLIVSTH